MKTFIGTKVLNAKPMTKSEYNIFRGWKLPSDENGDEPGMLVEYIDGGEPNTEEYAGYVSWSPVEVFNDAYRESGKMNFGHAIELMKRGHIVCRSGWDGKGMYIYLDEATAIEHSSDTPENIYDPCFVMFTAEQRFQPGWLASQADMLSNDWCIVDIDSLN